MLKGEGESTVPSGFYLFYIVCFNSAGRKYNTSTGEALL